MQPQTIRSGGEGHSIRGLAAYRREAPEFRAYRIASCRIKEIVVIYREDLTNGSETTCGRPSIIGPVSNCVYEKLSAADHCFTGQHLLSRAFYAVAVLEIKFAVAHFKNTDVGFAAGA
jgi:hypothetical protein